MSLDFYLFSYNTGTEFDFSSQDTIADFSVLDPIRVYNNTVSCSLTASPLITLIKDKYFLEFLGRGVIADNNIHTLKCVIPARKTTTNIKGLNINNDLIIRGLFGEISSSTFFNAAVTYIELDEDALVDNTAGPSLLNCTIYARKLIFTKCIDLYADDIRVENDITIGVQIKRSIVRAESNDCELTNTTVGGDINDKLIYEKEGVVKVIDPFTLST